MTNWKVNNGILLLNFKWFAGAHLTIPEFRWLLPTFVPGAPVILPRKYGTIEDEGREITLGRLQALWSERVLSSEAGVYKMNGTAGGLLIQLIRGPFIRCLVGSDVR